MSRHKSHPSGRARGAGRYLVGAVLWVLLVVFVAGVAWVAISSAGHSVTSGSLVADSGQDGAGAGPGTSTTASAAGGSRSATSSTTSTIEDQTPGQSDVGTPVPSATGSTANVATRTFRITAGRVTAMCTGSAIQLISAAPANGWSMSVEKSGPAAVEVEFEAGEAKVKVSAHCAGGSPAFTQTQDGGGEGSGSGGSGGGGSGSGGSGSGDSDD